MTSGDDMRNEMVPVVAARKSSAGAGRIFPAAAMERSTASIAMRTSNAEMKKPRKGFTSRRAAAYSAWRANSTRVNGQSQSTSVTDRPVMAFVVARWITSDGSTRKPASAVRATKARGSWRTCTIRPVSTMFQMITVTTSSTWNSGSRLRIYPRTLVSLATVEGTRRRTKTSSAFAAPAESREITSRSAKPRSGKECTLR